MEQYDLIVNQPVVIDNGSGVIKAGFAGDQVLPPLRTVLGSILQNLISVVNCHPQILDKFPSQNNSYKIIRLLLLILRYFKAIKGHNHKVLLDQFKLRL
jgi:hypothetical protein